MTLIASLVALLIVAFVIVMNWTGHAAPIPPRRKPKPLSGYQPTRTAKSGKVLPPPKNR